jgi:hypothetical protein
MRPLLINRAKVLEHIPNSIQVIPGAEHVDKELIKRLEVRRFRNSQKKYSDSNPP